MTLRIRKLVTTRELTFQEMGTAASRPIARAVGLAVIVRSAAERPANGLAELFKAGGALG
jgi:hypothetical protein